MAKTKVTDVEVENALLGQLKFEILLSEWETALRSMAIADGLVAHIENVTGELSKRNTLEELSAWLNSRS